MHVCRSLQEVIIRAAFADYHVIGVASKKNHDYLRKLGADRLYDYHDSTYLDEMAKDPKHKGLKVALDAIGKDTAEQCFAAFEKCGTGAGQGRVATTRPKEMQKQELASKPDSELTSARPLCMCRTCGVKVAHGEGTAMFAGYSCARLVLVSAAAAVQPVGRTSVTIMCIRGIARSGCMRCMLCKPVIAYRVTYSCTSDPATPATRTQAACSGGRALPDLQPHAQAPRRLHSNHDEARGEWPGGTQQCDRVQGPGRGEGGPAEGSGRQDHLREVRGELVIAWQSNFLNCQARLA